ANRFLVSITFRVQAAGRAQKQRPTARLWQGQYRESRLTHQPCSGSTPQASRNPLIASAPPRSHLLPELRCATKSQSTPDRLERTPRERRVFQRFANF